MDNTSVGKQYVYQIFINQYNYSSVHWYRAFLLEKLEKDLGGNMYSTQMEAAKKGIFTKEMEIVARDEQMSKEELMEKIAKGSIVIPANKNHKNIYPRAVGEGTRTKVNVNLGVSEDCCDYCGEMVKVQKAIEYGAAAIIDLSTF